MTNTAKELLTKKDAARFGRAVKAVAEEGLVAGSARPKMYIRYEPLVVAKAGLEATLMHAGRSSQDIHATFQRAILRDETLKLLKAQAAAVTGLLKLAHENEDTLIPCYTNGVAA